MCCDHMATPFSLIIGFNLQVCNRFPTGLFVKLSQVKRFLENSVRLSATWIFFFAWIVFYTFEIKNPKRSQMFEQHSGLPYEIGVEKSKIMGFVLLENIGCFCNAWLHWFPIICRMNFHNFQSVEFPQFGLHNIWEFFVHPSSISLPNECAWFISNQP